MIDKYIRLQETVDIIEQYAEQNFSEEDEMEIQINIKKSDIIFSNKQ